jgi:hypothetical protein
VHDEDTDLRRPARRNHLWRVLHYLGEKALDHIISLAIAAGVAFLLALGSSIKHYVHWQVVAGFFAFVLLGSILGLVGAGVQDVRNRLRRANEERIRWRQQSRLVEYQKEFIYNALESIQQELAMEEDWGLKDLAERGVLGPAAGLLERRALEDVRLAVLIAEEDGETWKMRWAAGHRPEGVRHYHRPINLTLAGRAYLNREVVIIDDVEQEPGFVRNPRATRDFRSLAAVPLLINEDVIGALSVISTEPAAFAEDDISFIRIVGALIDLLLAAEHDAGEHLGRIPEEDDQD